MTPLETAGRELMAEWQAYARRLGETGMPRAVTIRIEFDDETGMPRAVECNEERRRRVLGGAVGRTKRCGTAA
jgi:hypothetical protein